jgi:hypothetical protein
MPTEKISETQTEADEAVLAKAERRTRRSFLVGGAATVTAGVGILALFKSRSEGMLRLPMRRAEEFNRLLAERVIGETTPARTYPLETALKRPRSNGLVGLRQDIDPASWRLQLAGIEGAEKHPRYMAHLKDWKYRYDHSFLEKALVMNGGGEGVSRGMADSGITLADGQNVLPGVPESLPPASGLLLNMEEIRALPFTEYAVEFKCIEGWSEIVHFGGVRFLDFMKAYPPLLNPDGSLPKYVAMATPDGSFFSGYEMAAMVHPQTLLCYKMSGEDLTPVHGAPLRLACPLKYGYKQIKQIARISYTNTQPHEYWAEFGYDWHGGL